MFCASNTSVQTIALPWSDQCKYYTHSHIKSDQPGSHVFRWFRGQLSTYFYKIL